MTKNNWRGCEKIEFVYYNEWADPDLIYNGYTFNYWDIEDALWSEFCEIVSDETGLSVYDIESDMEKFEPMFNEYVQENAVNYIEDCIFGGYFADSSKSWHDR